MATMMELKMVIDRPYASALKRLRDCGLRPTKQRLALARLLFDGEDRHVTAEMLKNDADRAGARVSLATVYNTLNQFTDAGLLREVVVASDKSYFDTNTSAHHHFYRDSTGELLDICDEDLTLSRMPAAPEGSTVKAVDVVIRIT